ncbi:SHS2 domain-containing protein [Desulfacinum hydrothermale DSM 13146]|uniref:SHS2 domain-containing protein n=1 Tax=Desulfacinum hydrothermale DSM 13146 TaxID=1121390 RepID=A0A1W1X8Y5_9BACT|nr:archease [Desulfacinum hydrothermale]SMC20379.1 SHS2 domain-containing protein [Desulfacinum hydrothermale DSM 13146]
MDRRHPRVSAGYELLDHTADVGLRLRARSLEELFQVAAHAFYELMVDRTRVEDRERKGVALEAAALDELLVAWLSELLFLFETEAFLGRSVHVHLEEGKTWRLRGQIGGERLDFDRHELQLLYKAVTYHQLKVEQDAHGWHAQVIFDV